MKVRVIGAGIYGCHIAYELLKDGHDVVVHELKDDLFRGASGCIPARIHQGFHYPRSKKTRDACQAHAKEFNEAYSEFIRPIRTNIYAIAENHSLVDFEQYVDTLTGEVPFEIIDDPGKYGLRNVEGAVLTEECHIVTDEVREFFREELKGVIKFNVKPAEVDDPAYDITIDATFCAYDRKAIDRYEPCVVGIMESHIVDVAVTIMDGPFGSLYPWNPAKGLSSLSSARYTPFSKSCKTWEEARAILGGMSEWDLAKQIGDMTNDVAKYYTRLDQYKFKQPLTSIRAMPLSGADTRLIDIVPVGKSAYRIRAGKMDAVVDATRKIKEMI